MNWIEALVERGALKERDMLLALDRHWDARVPLGQLAVSQELMTTAQAVAVLAEQDESQRFGEVAVRLGYLTEVELESLRQLQKSLIPTVEELVLELGAVDPGVLAEVQKAGGTTSS